MDELRKLSSVAFYKERNVPGVLDISGVVARTFSMLLKTISYANDVVIFTTD